MRNVLLINGHIQHKKSPGNLNELLFYDMIHFFEAQSFQIDTTVVNKGYNVDEEVAKWLKADYIIFQTPIYWFSIPGEFKTYIDRVYQSGIFYTRSECYGNGGLLTDKSYMFSLTWNAPESIFNNSAAFYQGFSLEEAVLHLHKMNQYIGMKPIHTFSLHNVVREPNIPYFRNQLLDHLTKYLK